MTIKQKELIAVLKSHKNISDGTIHRWATKHGYKIDKVEESIYKIAQKCVRKKA